MTRLKFVRFLHALPTQTIYLKELNDILWIGNQPKTEIFSDFCKFTLYSRGLIAGKFLV